MVANENPLISVIIPIYKVESYLAKCVDSVRNQDYQNLEIILVDDGSPDNCPAMCDSFAKQDSRIHVIHKENGGLSDARNFGIEQAHGKYIIFVDSDDFLHKACISTLFNCCCKYEADLAIGNFRDFFEGEDVVETDLTQNNECEVFTPNKACRRNCSDVRFMTSWGKLIKSELVTPNLFPKGKIHEDEFTTYKLLFKANKVVYFKGELYYYLQRNNSIMGQKKSPVKKDAIEAFSERIAFYEQFDGTLVPTATERLVTHCLSILVQDTLENEERATLKNVLRDRLKKILASSNISPKIKLKWFLFIQMPWLFKIHESRKNRVH